jgi:hypothetical protein
MQERLHARGASERQFGRDKAFPSVDFPLVPVFQKQIGQKRPILTLS